MRLNSYKGDVHVTVHRVKFLTIKPTRCTNFSNLFLEWNSTCFGQFLCPSLGVFHSTCFGQFLCPSSGVFHSTYFGQFLCLLSGCFHSTCFGQFLCPSSGVFHCWQLANKLSANLYDVYHCRVYSEKLLMMNRGTVRNMQEFHSQNKFEKLMHPVGFIIRKSYKGIKAETRSYDSKQKEFLCQ